MKFFRSWEARALLIFLAVFFIAIAFSRAQMSIVEMDEFSHAQGGLVFREIGLSLLKDHSISGVRDAILQDHLHYKSFSGFALYPPLHTLFIGIAFSVFGVGRYIAILPTIIEAVLILLFMYKFANLVSRNRGVSLLAAVLLGLSPFFFFYSGTAYLEMGVALFVLMSAYYFSLYLMGGRGRDLYLTAASAALGILVKPPMVLVFPALLFILLWTGRAGALRRDWKKILLALAILFLIVSPWIAEEAYFKSQGVSPTAFDKWFVHHLGRSYGENISEGFVLAGYNPMIYYNVMGFHQNLVFYLSVIFFQWYLIPFIILGLCHARRPNIPEKAAIAMIIVFLVGFSLTDAHTRYIMVVMPFVLLFVAFGLWRAFKDARIRYPVIALVLALALVQSSAVFGTVHREAPLQNYEGAADFIIRDSRGEVSVVSSEGAAQGFIFSILDKERKAYIIYTPAKRADLEAILNGTYQHEGKWEAYNMTHPPVVYVLVYERHKTKSNYDYNVLEFMEQREDFELAETIEGVNEGSKIFIYKRQGNM